MPPTSFTYARSPAGSVVASLAVESELLDRPRADVAYPQQPLPCRFVLAQVDAAARDRARGLDHRQRPPRRQVERAQLRGRARRERRRRRRVAQALVAAPAPAPDDPSLDVLGALRLDQLLGDCPGERLERFGSPQRPRPRAAADDRTDQRIALERPVEV